MRRAFNFSVALPAAVLLLGIALPSVTFANIETPDGAVNSPETPLGRAIARYLETSTLRDVRIAPEVRIGLTPRLELALSLPVVLSHKITAPSGDANLTGLADLRIGVKYSVHQVDGVMASTRWSILGEVIAPTGKNDATVNGARIPRRLQLGTGSWGVGLGGVYTLVRDCHRASVFVGGVYFNRREGFRPGPELRVKLAYWYRIAPARFDPNKRSMEVRGVLELLTEYRFESRRGPSGAGDEGALVWFAPGLQIYASPTIQFEFNVSIPLVNGINDALGDRRWAAALAVKIRF